MKKGGPNGTFPRRIPTGVSLWEWHTSYGWRDAATFKRIGAYYFLLERRLAEGMTLIIPYERDELEEASADYLAFEEEGRDVVLVSTDSLEDVRRAYPNYWLDARLFLREMEGIL